MQSAEGAVTKDIAEAKAERLLYWLGFRPTYKGFAYLACGIQLAAQDSDYLTHLTTALYPAIAQHFQTTADSVERSLRTAIQAFWKNGNRDLFNKIAGYAIKNKPYTGEFIGILSAYLRLQGIKL